MRPVPPNLADALEAHGVVPEWGEANLDGEPCEGADHHSPIPLTIGAVSLNPFDVDDDEMCASLCPTCEANMHLLQALLVRTNGELPWIVRREFGNGVRVLAMKGWKHFGVSRV